MTHDFVVNTENVNEYKFRVLTSGIDTKQYLRNPVVLYIHTRENKDDENRGSEVVGRCIALTVKGTELIATIEFDEEDPFAKKIAGKVKRGYLRMTSIYADVVETSMDPELILEGQLYATVTKSKLVEISIVPIGGNDDALKLSRYGFDPVKLNNPTNIKTTENMSQFKTIAVALSLSADADESSLVKEIQKIKLDKQTSDNKVQELTTKFAKLTKEEGTQLIDKIVELGLLPEGLKAIQLSAYEADPEGQKVILEKLIAEKTSENLQLENTGKIKEVVLKGKSTIPAGNDSNETFDYLQKHDPVKLGKIRDADPAKYAQLAMDYSKGVRHPETK